MLSCRLPTWFSSSQLCISITFLSFCSPDPTYWPTSVRKNHDILNIFVAKITNNIYGNNFNILDFYFDHSSLILTLNATYPWCRESPKLFNCTTKKIKLHELVDHGIILNIKLKSKDNLNQQ